MTNKYDQATEIAISNDDGCNVAVCDIADRIFLLIEGNAELCTLFNHRPNAKRFQRTVSAEWAYKFLTRANGVTIRPYRW
jgi:hypothetical protein